MDGNYNMEEENTENKGRVWGLGFSWHHPRLESNTLGVSYNTPQKLTIRGGYLFCFLDHAFYGLAYEMNFFGDNYGVPSFPPVGRRALRFGALYSFGPSHAGWRTRSSSLWSSPLCIADAKPSFSCRPCGGFHHIS